MPAVPKLSTILSSLFYLLPLYLFIGAPILRQLYPTGTTDSISETPAPKTDHLSDDNFVSVDDGVPLDCPGEDDYRVHILSREPLVMYIEGFLSGWEADHLVDMSVGNYTPSIIYSGTTPQIDPTKRLSDRALLPRDTTVRCIEERARAFQGWKPHLYIERMWAQRYNVSGHYGYHYDWAGTAAQGGDRISTFMVYLGDECRGGGTYFPRLERPVGRAWCRFLECEGDGAGEGVTFRPIKGNAIFWVNLRQDGMGYPETWHKAFPVEEGTKVGLNIWSWYQPPPGRGSWR